MNSTEAVQLCRIVKSLCPTQPFDEATPDAWALVLDDIRFPDAQQAVRILYRERGNDQEWGGRRIEADDIIRQVRRLREDRLRRTPLPAPPPDLTPTETIAWQRATTRAIADGESIPHPEITDSPCQDQIHDRVDQLRQSLTDRMEEA